MLLELDEEKNWMHAKLTPTGTLIITVLVLALVALGERILYDLARTFAGGDLNYFDNLDVIIVHSFFVIPLLIVSIVISAMFGINRGKKAMVLIPYFVFSIVMALQLVLQVSVYFANHHTKLQLYIVMLLLIFISSLAIYYIQKRYNPV